MPSTLSADAVVVRNNVVVSGNPSGRPILFAHGFGCNQQMWRYVVPHFARECQIVLFDLVGAGGSDLSAYDAGKYDSLHGYADDDGYVGGFSAEAMDSLLDALDTNYLGWSATLAPVVVGNADRPELGEELTESFCRIDPVIARHLARVTFLSDNRADLHGVTTPTLILQCTDDAIAPLAAGRFVHDGIDGSTLVVMSATGHCPNLSDPDQVAREMAAFLD